LIFISGNIRKLTANCLPVLAVSCLLGLLLWPLPKSITPSYSKVVRFSDGSVMRTYISADQKWRIFLPLEKIDPLYIRTALAYEDRWFYWHPGVNPVSLARALYLNLKAGRVISGGSTITMQLARLSEPKPRTVFSKLWEIFRAFQFELRLGKRRILELYLNLAPYGGNVEGIGAACLGYYGRLPDRMTPEESAFLVWLPRSPSLKKHRDKTSPIDGRDKVLDIMRRRSLIDEGQYRRSLKAAMPSKFRQFPCMAPHMADYLVQSYPDKNDIISTIDRNVQLKSESILRSYDRKMALAGASNASLVVIDNRTRRVRAAVGSLDYFDEQRQGQVRGFASYRSPGSTLKPFLYILSLERGLINPEMLLEDAPYQFGGFAPVNFSEDWSGLVKAEDALSRSLNLPFVLMLRRYGYYRFEKKIRELGLIGPLAYGSYGLPIITGGMDVRLLDLTNAYVSLAKGGRHGKQMLLETDTVGTEKQVFRLGAVWLALQALGKKDRPDAPNVSRYTMPKARIFWKTGTSFGRRDAWSIGFLNDYTVGIWVGNFSGEGSDSIVGALAAAPVMFDILRALEDNFPRELPWEREAKKEIDIIPVCAYSGYKAGPYCPKTKLVKSLKNAEPFQTCPFHQNFIVEKRTGYRASPWKNYRKGELSEKVFLVYPSQVQLVLAGQGREPQFEPQQRIAQNKKSLELVSPVDGSIYMVPVGVRNTGHIPLQAFTSAGRGKIHWFANDVYIGDTESGEIMELEPKGWQVRITAQDEAGNNRTVKIEIRNEVWSL